MRIRIFYDEIKYRIRRSTGLKRFVEKVIREEKKVPGDLNFIVTNDREITQINKEFLERDYLTDVITFNYCVEDIINGEVYINLDMVRRNSKLYQVRLEEELVRTIIHGVLHLCNYDDEDSEAKDIMRRREDYWLKYYFG